MTAHVEPKTATLNIRIEPALMKLLRASAKRQKMSHAELVRKAIRRELHNEGVKFIKFTGGKKR